MGMDKVEFAALLKDLNTYLGEKLEISETPLISFRFDEEAGDDILGTTGLYSPDDSTIYLYMQNRHPKDVLRSFAHEMIHHWQNENGKLEEGWDFWDMESEAYLLGNVLFREWEDLLKGIEH